MFKTIRDMLLGALLVAAIGHASALTGNPPQNGPGLVDGTWLNGLANGQNYSYQSGITAAGTTQATATQLPAAIYMLEADTVAGSTGVNAPPALPGTQFILYNNGSNTLTIYPAVANNPTTAAQDTINNATSITLTAHTSIAFACAKAGVWNAS